MQIPIIVVIVASLFSLEVVQIAAVAANTAKEATVSTQGDNPKMSLREQLDELAAQSKSKVPEATAKVMKKALDDLDKSGIVNQVLKKSAHAPDFSLPNASGQTVSLKQLLGKGPVVLSFYRGGWCPYCNLALRALENALPAIEAENATLVAVSPQLPDASLSVTEKDRLTFEVLSDSGNSVAKQFGIVFKLSPDLIKVYKDFGIDLVRTNGDQTNELPLAATFIIDRDGTIAYAFADVDYKKRMEPSDIVAVLKRIRK
ncbi:peroxiredoxin-like family protein [soil metagenome]